MGHAGPGPTGGRGSKAGYESELQGQGREHSAGKAMLYLLLDRQAVGQTVHLDQKLRLHASTCLVLTTTSSPCHDNRHRIYGERHAMGDGMSNNGE